MTTEIRYPNPIDDDYGTCQETWAELRLRSASLSLPELVAALALEAGDLSSRGQVASRDLRRHLDWLGAKLAGRGEALAALRRQGADAEIYCPWRGEMGGPTFWPAQMQTIAALGLDLVLDYSWADPTELNAQD